jgi:hypothetical protein
MVLGFGGKTRWGSAVLLLLISWGLLATEVHGILGHAHNEQTCPDQYNTIGDTTPGLHLDRLEGVQDDPLCSICLSFRLLRHSLIPATHCIIVSLYFVQPVSIQSICLVEVETPHKENRSPPIA